MKLKKRILSIFLSLSLLSGMFFAMPTTASAASEENVNKAMGFLETTVGSLLDKNTIFTNWTVTQLVKTVAGAMGGIAGGMLSVGPKEMSGTLYEFYENNPLQPYVEENDWSKVPDSLDWGVKTGDMDSFFKAVQASVRVLGPILSVVLADNAWQEGNPPDMSLGIPIPLYRFLLHDVMGTLKLNNVASFETMNAACTKLLADYGDPDYLFKEAYAQYLEAKAAGNLQKMEELKPVLEENGQKAIKAIDDVTSLILNPIFDLIRDFFADPLGVLLEKLPLLDKSIRKGELDIVISMLLPGARTGTFTLVDLANEILKGVSVGNPAQPLGIVLTAKDFSAMENLSRTEKFEAVVTYVCEVLRNETNGVKDPSNLNAVKALLASMDLGDLQQTVDGALTGIYTAPTASAGANSLINTLAMVGPTDPDPTVPTDPTGTTKPSDATTTTKPADTTKPGSTDKNTTTTTGQNTTTQVMNPETPEDPGSPKTGDIALGVFAMLSITAAAAVVVMRKKHD